MWSVNEERRLRGLRIDPTKSDRAKLNALVEHFGSGGTIYSVTDKGIPVLASRAFARKIKELTQRGRLAWLTKSDEDLRVSENPAFASRKHWVDLKNVARILGNMTSSAPPFAQLLGFPWCTNGLEGRAGLVTNFQSGTAEISLEAEQSLYLDALREHLTTHRAWGNIDSWIFQVQELMSELISFCELVDVRSHLEGNTKITKEQARLGQKGVTEFFARSITLDAAERACGISRNVHHYEQTSHHASGVKTLLLYRDSSSFIALASSTNSAELDQLQHHHQTMRDSMVSEPEGQRVVESYQRVEKSSKALSAQLLRIANLVELPGGCSFY